jgi:membrane glycosyltransferase
LRPVSRYQLAFALLMFLGSPAWMGLLVFGSLGIALADTPAQFVRADYGLALLAVVLVMWFAPKIATMVDVLTRAELRRSFGGGLRFSASVLAETVFFLLLSPMMWFGHTAFLIGLPLGRGIGWIGQARDDHSVPWSVAARQLWPQSLLGLGTLALLAFTVPAAIPYALLIAGGLALSVPFAVLTADPRFGRVLARIGIGCLPEETSPSALNTLGLASLRHEISTPMAPGAAASCSRT